MAIDALQVETHSNDRFGERVVKKKEGESREKKRNINKMRKRLVKYVNERKRDRM